jgi:DNA recombination protein RmuC
MRVGKKFFLLSALFLMLECLIVDLVITLIIVAAALIVLVVFLNYKLSDLKKAQKPSDELLEYLKTTNTRLNEQSKNFNERLDNAARVISQVQKNIGEFSEIGRGMKDLQEFLSSPKLRGNIGEQVLKELLKQFLPKESFNLQYTFKSGEKVDAAIKTSGGIIPVDSKFPMENFRKMSGDGDEVTKKLAAKDFERDVRKHIDDISRKYILTEEGTIDYALMYIPSESIYYEIVNNQALFDYAGEKRVLPVSPTTFYAYLKAILMSFEGQKIEDQAKEILSSLRAIKSDYGKVEENLSILQKHLTNAYNMMGNVFSSFANLGQKISSTQNLGDSRKEKKELESEV